MEKVLEFESEIEFVANINDHKDCLMSQDPTQETPDALWYNIDIPKGHILKAGDRIRITVEKLWFFLSSPIKVDEVRIPLL